MFYCQQEWRQSIDAEMITSSSSLCQGESAAQDNSIMSMQPLYTGTWTAQRISELLCYRGTWWLSTPVIPWTLSLWDQTQWLPNDTSRPHTLSHSHRIPTVTGSVGSALSLVKLPLSKETTTGLQCQCPTQQNLTDILPWQVKPRHLNRVRAEECIIGYSVNPIHHKPWRPNLRQWGSLYTANETTHPVVALLRWQFLVLLTRCLCWQKGGEQRAGPLWSCWALCLSSSSGQIQRQLWSWGPSSGNMPNVIG